MILRPLSLPVASSESEIVPAWKAVAATQQQNSSAWWLIAQPDHAALAGSLAAHFKQHDFPLLDREAVQAIALHDAGWAALDGGGEAGGGTGEVAQFRRDHSGRPLSFLEAPVTIFVGAWAASIRCAEAKAGAIAGLMVSGHFCRLAQNRLSASQDTAEDAARLAEFVRNAAGEDERRFARQARSRHELDRLVDLLQFCDLLSLYLCCGSRASVQFPQLIGERPVVLRRDGELCRLEPSPFGEELSLGVPARRAPMTRDEPSTCFLPVRIQ
jgi:cell division septum initiation protein DivIVA